jgi:hypothetical protein
MKRMLENKNTSIFFQMNYSINQKQMIRLYLSITLFICSFSLRAQKTQTDSLLSGIRIDDTKLKHHQSVQHEKMILDSISIRANHQRDSVDWKLKKYQGVQHQRISSDSAAIKRRNR